MSIITPFETGVKSAGGGYHPKFKATGGLIVEPQPEAKTPAVKTSYFTTTHKLRNRKNFIYSQPEFENVRRKPGDPYPSSKPSFHGNLAGGGIDWKNPNIGQYRETANATENRMIIDGQQKGERFPIQWLKPSEVHFVRHNKSILDYKKIMSDANLRKKVDALKVMGYSEAEIKRAIEKERDDKIQKVLNERGLIESDIRASVAQANHEAQFQRAFDEHEATLHSADVNTVRGTATVGSTSPNRTEQLIAAAAAAASPLPRAGAGAPASPPHAAVTLRVPRPKGASKK